jgi:hypothetical protein
VQEICAGSGGDNKTANCDGETDSVLINALHIDDNASSVGLAVYKHQGPRNCLPFLDERVQLLQVLAMIQEPH